MMSPKLGDGSPGITSSVRGVFGVIDYGQYLPDPWPLPIDLPPGGYWRSSLAPWWPHYFPPQRPQPDMIGMLREWQLDELARAADEQAQRDRLRAWVVDQTGPGGVPVKDWMEDE